LTLEAVTNWLPNPVTTLFLVLMGGFFLYAISRPRGTARHANLPFDTFVTSTLFTLGVLGTFVGVYIALQHFDVANLDKSIQGFLSALKVVFLTSIVGMALSLLYKTLRQGGRSEPEEAGDDAVEFMAIVREQRDLLREVQTSLVGEGDSTLITQMQKLRTSQADHLDGLSNALTTGFKTLVGEFRDFAHQMSENNAKALIGALEQVIQDFNEKLTVQFGDNFKQLNHAVGAMVDWQDHYRVHVERLEERFNQSTTSLQQVADSTSQIVNQTRAISTVAEDLQALIKTANAQTSELQRHLEAFSALKDSACQAFPVIETTVTQLTKNFSEAVVGSVGRIDTVLEKQDEAFHAIQETLAETQRKAAKDAEALQKQFSTVATTFTDEMDRVVGHLSTHVEQTITDSTQSLADHQAAAAQTLQEGFAEHQRLAAKGATELQERMATTSTAFADEMKQLTGQLRTNVEQAITDSTGALADQVEKLDREMQEEVKRMVETMGGHLGSLSKKFVDDYAPLTDRLREWVEVGRRT